MKILATIYLTWFYIVLIVHAVCICHVHSACNVDIMELSLHLTRRYKTPARNDGGGGGLKNCLFVWVHRCPYYLGELIVCEIESKNCVVDAVY